MNALGVEGFTQMTDQSLKMDFRESLKYTNKWLLTNYIYLFLAMLFRISWASSDI